MTAQELRSLPAAMIDGLAAGEVAANQGKTQVYFENWESAVAGAGGFDYSTGEAENAE
jgi:hypothetical protein